MAEIEIASAAALLAVEEPAPAPGPGRISCGAHGSSGRPNHITHPVMRDVRDD